MKQNKRIPRISTRGFYDLSSGKTLKKKSYDLYPKKFFEELGNYPEFTIMVHGMRNNKSGALEKFRIAKKRLRQLGYRYPVVGFSYDSNIKGARYDSHEKKAIIVGRTIAKKNGKNLAKFILDLKKENPDTQIRLIGHSLGSEVILYAVEALKRRRHVIETVCFFGSSIPTNYLVGQKFTRLLQKVVRKTILNYYNPDDKVLKSSQERKIIEKPIGCYYLEGMPKKYRQRRVKTRNHRFASYMMKATSFP